MINLIVFGLMVASFSGVVFWLARDRNNYYCARRDASKKLLAPLVGKSVPLFDTLRYFKRLCDTGIPEAHADAMTEALVVALNEAFSEAIRRRK